MLHALFLRQCLVISFSFLFLLLFLRSCTFLTCTIKGNTIIRSIEVPRSQNDTVNEVTQTTWATSGSGDILCSKVDESENFALFGG